jgi:hypothetical protein
MKVVQEVYSGLNEEAMAVRAGMKYMKGSVFNSEKSIRNLSGG